MVPPRSDGLIPAEGFVVVDWGTSSFRGWLMSADGTRWA
jgi:2-keto-3-deoxy-galactonokinase